MTRTVHTIPFVICPPDDLVQQRPELRRMSQALSRKYADNNVVTEENLQAVGSAMWNALNGAGDFDAAYQQAGVNVLPIIIQSHIPEIQALPWETLFHPSLGFLGKHPAFTLSRRMVQAQMQPVRFEKGPLRVLLFTSLPEDVNPEKGRLNVEEEQIQVQEALLPWISRGLVQLEIPDDGRFSTLKVLLRNFQPHVLFFSGHGKFHYEPHTGELPYGEFLFEGETGRGEGIRGEEIAAALVGSGVQLVVLSACESSKSASADLANGLAQRISAQGISQVIGMRESILDRAGIQFARALCDELAGCERVDCALQSAREAIQKPLKGISRREAGRIVQEELSLGQWCLPMLLSLDPARPLIDWDFQSQMSAAPVSSKTLSSVRLPPRFIGRRAEMRQYKGDLLAGRIHKLLITGPGGQGKTALAGRLALDLRGQGYHVFDWSIRPENPWSDFQIELELALEGEHATRYDRFCARRQDEAQRARFLIKELMEQYGQRVVLFLDNLESVQDPDTLAVQDPTAAAWLLAAQSTPDLVLLATSRWQIPGWVGEHLALYHASYGDFLQMAQQFVLRRQLKKEFLQDRQLPWAAFEILGGNSRGLEFFAAATLAMNGAEVETFLQQLAHAQSDLQANMAIEAIYGYLSAPARALLQRLPNYSVPVPPEGIIKLGLDLDDPENCLERLAAVSLVEQQYERQWEVVEYQCPALVIDWMRNKEITDKTPAWMKLAADYHLYLYENERRTLIQAVNAYNALRCAQRDSEADRLVLDAIVGPLTLAGLYSILLKDWLPRICDSEDPATRSAALGQTGKILIHTGEYDTALGYLKQSLAICQQIGDKAGEGTTLNNISQIYDAQGEYDTALGYLKQSLAIRQQIGDKAGLCATLFNMGHLYAQRNQIQEAVGAWVTVYQIAKPMNLTQALQALSNLAPQLGLPPGLEGWEVLSQRFE